MKTPLRFEVGLIYIERIFKNSEIGWSEGERYEHNGDDIDQGKRKLWGFADSRFVIEGACFADIRKCRRNEKYCDIYPIWRFGYGSVVGIEYYGYEQKPVNDTAELHTPKVLAVFKEKALNYGVDKHGPKQ